MTFNHPELSSSPPHAPVVLAAIDAMRADALAEVDCPNLMSLRQRGAYTLRAQSVMPSISLPCFLSIFHSLPPQRHGTLDNTYVPMASPVPGLFDLAKEAGLRCGAIYNWEPLRDVSTPRSLDFAYMRANVKDGPLADGVMVEQALQYVAEAQPDFVFVYLGTLDVMGHAHGFHSPQYFAHLKHMDSYVGRLLEGLPPTASLIVTSDHGGHANTHGTDSPDDMVIPMFFTGPPFHRNHALQREIDLLDIAPTVAHLLGVEAHPDWEGTRITEAFA